MIMTKNVEITIDIDTARKMLKSAGFSNVDLWEDDVVFTQVLATNEEYGITSFLLEDKPDVSATITNELLQEIKELRKQYLNLFIKGHYTKTALRDLAHPFRKKYNLSAEDALNIVSCNTSMAETARILSKSASLFNKNNGWN